MAENYDFIPSPSYSIVSNLPKNRVENDFDDNESIISSVVSRSDIKMINSNFSLIDFTDKSRRVKKKLLKMAKVISPAVDDSNFPGKRQPYVLRSRNRINYGESMCAENWLKNVKEKEGTINNCVYVDFKDINMYKTIYVGFTPNALTEKQSIAEDELFKKPEMVNVEAPESIMTESSITDAFEDPLLEEESDESIEPETRKRRKESKSVAKKQNTEKLKSILNTPIDQGSSTMLDHGHHRLGVITIKKSNDSGYFHSCENTLQSMHQYKQYSEPLAERLETMKASLTKSESLQCDKLHAQIFTDSRGPTSQDEIVNIIQNNILLCEQEQRYLTYRKTILEKHGLDNDEFEMELHNQISEIVEKVRKNEIIRMLNRYVDFTCVGCFAEHVSMSMKKYSSSNDDNIITSIPKLHNYLSDLI